MTIGKHVERCFYRGREGQSCTNAFVRCKVRNWHGVRSLTLQLFLKPLKALGTIAHIDADRRINQTK